MTYKEKYDSIINHRKENPLPENEYGEMHHIVPKSICPILAKAKDNMVRLSAQEHFLAHYYLWKAYRDELKEKTWARKMCFAFHTMKSIMMKCNDIEKVSELYAEVKKDFKIEISKIMKENGPWSGKHLSEKHRRKISDALRDKSKTKETRIRMSCAQRGNKNWLGKHHTKETRNILSKQKLGKNNPNFGMHWYTNGTINILACECPPGFTPGRLCRCN